MITNSVIQKSQIERTHRLDGEHWFKYIKPIYAKRKKLTGFKNSPLITVIESGDYDRLSRLVKIVTEYVRNAEQIFGATKQLNDKEDPDEKINDIIGELRAAYYLIDCGYRNIIYQKKELDFICKKDDVSYCAEVKFIRGSDFKTQQRNNYGSYSLSPTKLISILRRKYKEAEDQIAKYKIKSNQSLVIIVTNLLESDKFWFGGSIEKWRQSAKIETVILTNGDIYE